MSGSTGATPVRTARYVPGAGNVVVRGDVLVALPYAPADRAAGVWDALDGAAGVMDALQVLSSTFDAGLAALPPFAVVVLTAGGRAHVLVRGDVEVRVDASDGPVELHGRDVSTWTERAVDGVDGVRVLLGTSSGASASGDGDAAAPATLPLVGGVVRARAATWGASSWVQGAAPAGAADGADGAAAAGLTSGTDLSEAAGARTEGTGDRSSADRTGPGDVPAAPALVTGVPGMPPFQPTSPPAPAPGDAVAPAAPTAGAVTAVPSDLTLAPMETIAPGRDGQDDASDEAAGPAEPAPAGGAASDDAADDPAALGADDDYQSLWETTIHRSVEGAAVRVEESEEADGSASPDGPGSPDGSGDGPAGDAPDGPDGFDHDGHTVMGSSVADLRAVAAAAAAQLAASGDLPAFSAPAVPSAPVPSPPGPDAQGDEDLVAGPPLVARLCVAGHPNPPSRERCATCGLALSGQTQTVARPPLGRVRVAGGEPDGQAFPLDRPLVVGRRPRSPKGQAAALHRIVTVPSPQQDISRSHVEVRLEGWNVLAVDLNTTNGTTLLRPGQTPLRMHPGEPVLVVAGDVADLGDGVTLSFEDVP